ncbi:MAG: hypothetical protein AAGE52_39990 [Myxococcota bacterium]
MRATFAKLMTLHRLTLVALLACFIGCGDDDSTPPTGCTSDDECADPTSVCRIDTNTCVECIDSSTCPADTTCSADNRCEPDEVAECMEDEDCPTDRPRCLIGEDGLGFCIASCETDDQCPNGACVDSTCLPCDPNPESALIGDPCVCNQDCFGLETMCVEGECAGDCTMVGCPPDSECTGTPGECVSCLEATDQPAGTTCLCDRECASGLTCIAGTCGEACEFDETCGRQECGHSLTGAPTCREPDAACFGSGASPLGQECACNADCDFDAPVCVSFLAEGTPGFACSQVCGPEQPCPSGSMCCGTGALRYCLSGELAAATGSTCE